MAKTLFERIWERHVVAEPEGEPALLFVDLHLIHEVTSAQAFDGLRLAGRSRPPTRSVARDDGSQRSDRGRARDGSARPGAARRAQPQLRGVRRSALRDRQRPRGDRPRDRPRARRDAAGDDDRLRRQPHLDAWRIRRARVRRRHVRSGARARDAVSPAGAAALDARPLRGRASPERDGQGHDPRRDRQARGGRRGRTRARVHRRGDSGPLDGEPDDDLQHVDRSRRAGGDDRSRRDDVRLPGRPSGRTHRPRLGAGSRRVAGARLRSRCYLRLRSS